MEARMVRRDVSRSGVRNGRRLMRDRSGRLLGSTRIVLSAIQVRAVERMFRTGRSLEAIADTIGVELCPVIGIKRGLIHKGQDLTRLRINHYCCCSFCTMLCDRRLQR